MRRIFLAVLALGLSQSTLAASLNGEQMAYIYVIKSNLTQASARAFYAYGTLKNENKEKACFILGSMVSEMDAAAKNLNILLRDDSQKTIPSKMLAPFYDIKKSVDKLNDVAVSTLSACGNSAYHWVSQVKLSDHDVKEALRTVNESARDQAKDLIDVLKESN